MEVYVEETMDHIKFRLIWDKDNNLTVATVDKHQKYPHQYYLLWMDDGKPKLDLVSDQLTDGA